LEGKEDIQVAHIAAAIQHRSFDRKFRDAQQVTKRQRTMLINLRIALGVKCFVGNVL
jgi:hypothetical protein